MGRLDGKVALISGGAGGRARPRPRPSRARAPGWSSATSGTTRDARWRRPFAPGAVQTALDRHGRLDILINDAAITIPRVPIEERAAAEWDHVMAVNAKGVFLGTKHAIPALPGRAAAPS